MQSVDTNKLIVTRSNDFAFGAYTADLSRDEFLFIYFFVGLIRMEDTEFKQHEMDVVDLVSPLDIRQKDIYGFIDTSTDNLMKLFVKIPRGEGSWRKKKVFDYIDYIDAKDSETGKARIAVRFDDDMKPYILQLKRRFGSDPFEEFRNLKANKCSTYSMEIFDMLCIRYQERKQRRIYMDLDDLKKSLGLEKKYPNYHDFKRNVLDKAEKECRKNTSLSFTFEPKRKGRRVVGIDFLITEKITKQPAKSKKAVIDTPFSTLAKELKQIGFNGDIDEIIAEHGEGNIRAVLEYALVIEKEQRNTDAKIRSLPRFIQHLIKDKHWKVLNADKEKKDNERVQAKRAQMAAEKANQVREVAKKIRQKFEQEQGEVIKEFWTAASDIEKEKIRKAISTEIPLAARRSFIKWEKADREGQIPTGYYLDYIGKVAPNLGYFSFNNPLKDVNTFARIQLKQKSEFSEDFANKVIAAL